MRIAKIMNSEIKIQPLQNPIDQNEIERIKALDRYDVLDDEFTDDFRNLLQVASALFKVPMVSISFVHENHISQPATWGYQSRNCSRKNSFCEEVFAHRGQVVIIQDAVKDPRFENHEYVINAPYIRFYAAAPLQTEENLYIGCLEIMNTTPGTLNETEIKMLATLAKQIMYRLDLSYRFYSLQKARSFYQSLVDNLPESICILRKDLNGNFTFGNKNFCKLINKTSQEIIGTTDFDYYEKEQAEKYRLDDEKVINTKESLIINEANTDANGKKHYVHVIKMPLFEPDNPYELVGLQCIFWDETQRIVAEEEAKTHKNFLQCLMDMSADCIYFKDKESKFLHVSQSMLKHFGVTKQEDMRGKRDSDFFTSSHAKCTVREEQDIMKKNEPIVGKVEHEIWKDGRETWSLTNKAPLKDAQDKTIGTFGISKDITKLKKTEEELKKARDKALEATRLKSEFLANMSHEIRTPMNAIIGMTEQLGMTKLNSQQREFLSYINNSSNSLLAIINDILDFSKIEAGKMTIELIDCSLHQTIADTVYPLTRLADEKHLELLTQIDDNVPDWVLISPDRIRQILTNLIGNAIKFTISGEILLQVSLLKKINDQCWDIQFSVKDTGIGIPEDVIPKLFTAFSQADGSTTRKFGGTGLGLAICKQLVSLMKGSISVTSKPGKGSTFTFHIPIKQAHSKNTQDNNIPSTNCILGKRCLIVDDNKTNRQIVRINLEHFGAEVIEAENGGQALAILEKYKLTKIPLHFALLDYQMPEMDGLQLAQKIREDEYYSNMSLVLLTSVCSIQSAQILTQSGINRFLIKPIRKQKLLECLLSIMNNRPQPEILSQQSSYEISRRVPDLNEQDLQKLASLKILIVEDMELNLKILQMQLSQMNLHAENASNGEIAVEAFKQQHYDLIFMDCQMPKMDGYQATRLIREFESKNKTKKPVFIVAMTANALEGDREKCLSAGMNDYLTKPFRQNDLKAFLSRFTQKFFQEENPLSSFKETSDSSEKNKLTSPEKEISASAFPIPPDEFDMSFLEGLRMMEQENVQNPLKEACQYFSDDAQRNTQPLVEAAQQNDFDKIRLHSHGLKGICLNLGAQKAGNLFLEIETSARKKENKDYISLIKPALDELEKVKKFFIAYVNFCEKSPQ